LFSQILPVLKGLASYIPFLHEIRSRQRMRAAATADYCYEVWLKHLCLLTKNGMDHIPESVVELGPGNSLGIGICALLSGSQNYYALDVVDFSASEDNRDLLRELVVAFKERRPKPGTGWPNYDDCLNEDLFPDQILTDGLLEKTLAEDRVEAIDQAISNSRSDDGKITISYIVPWEDESVLPPESANLVLSQSVMEHVNDIENAYHICANWLKPGGWLSHQMDFRSHGLTPEWNGHWAFSDFWWKVVIGRKPFLINRRPFSQHLSLLQKTNLKIVSAQQKHRQDGLKVKSLASPWSELTNDDVTCSGALIQAQKPIFQLPDEKEK